MRVPTIILAVAAVELGSTALADPYKDLAAQGYRWVIVDGPYACPSKDDLREITRHRTDLLEVKMVSDLRAYYLIRGVIIQVVQEDAASGMSEVHLRVRGIRILRLSRVSFSSLWRCRGYRCCDLVHGGSWSGSELVFCSAGRVAGLV
jgi:hypothetical protein